VGERPLLFVVLKPEHKGKVGQDDLKQFMAKFAGQGKLPDTRCRNGLSSSTPFPRRASASWTEGAAQKPRLAAWLLIEIIDIFRQRVIFSERGGVLFFQTRQP